jgi:hypothetical protein
MIEALPLGGSELRGNPMKHVRLALSTALFTCSFAASAITFVPGHFYSTSDSAINQYSPTGTLISSLADSRSDLRGISFGPDGLLYVVHAGNPFSGAASVEAINNSGTVVRSYAFTGSINGNNSYGKISFDASGQNFYVGAGNGIYRFGVTSSSGSIFKNVEAFDLKVLPSGDLMVASGYAVSRYDSTGVLTSSISTLSDPNGLTGASNPFLVDVRGLEYDFVTNTTYVSMLGYSGAVNMSFKIIALAGSSNAITGIENYWYGDDLLVTDGGKLLVGSRTQAPGVFSTSLAYQAQFNGPSARFVAMLAVPEPPPMATLALGLGILIFLCKRRVA